MYLFFCVYKRTKKLSRLKSGYFAQFASWGNVRPLQQFALQSWQSP